tara:strand:- start:879 stop:1235 length:357 start_codon:yes stop_codon:yes gene_type:complete
MRLLVCGDRNWTDKNKIRQEVIELCSIAHISVIIEGGARGADRLAGEVADELDISLLVFPAKWTEFGKSAGPRRNQQMLDEGQPDQVLAFHNNIQESKGTKHMIDIAQRSNIPVKLIQ